MLHRWNDSVHQAFGGMFSHRCGERDKGSGRAPPINPRGPARKSVLRTALTSREPDCGRLDSTYSSHPWDSPPRGQRKRCSKLLPAILSCLGSPISAGTHPLAVRPEIKAMKVLLWARFCRPDKRKRHPAIHAAVIMPDGGSTLSGLWERSY